MKVVHVEKTMRINRSVEEVFDFIADARNETSWNPSLIRFSRPPSGPVTTGTRFTAQYKRIGDLDVVVTKYDRPRELGFHCEGRQMVMDLAFHFACNGTGTAVSAIADVQPRGVLKLMRPVLGPMLSREFGTREPALKKVLEGR